MAAESDFISKLHNPSLYTYPNGDKYYGEWSKEGKMEGKGIYTYANGKTYEGRYKDHMKHGYGIMTCGDGVRYEGEWMNNLRHGFGTQTYLNGDQYSGEFINDKEHGNGILKRNNGEIIRSSWNQGVMLPPPEDRTSQILKKNEANVNLMHRQIIGDQLKKLHTPISTVPPIQPVSRPHHTEASDRRTPSSSMMLSVTPSATETLSSPLHSSTTTFSPDATPYSQVSTFASPPSKRPASYAGNVLDKVQQDLLGVLRGNAPSRHTADIKLDTSDLTEGDTDYDNDSPLSPLSSVNMPAAPLHTPSTLVPVKQKIVRYEGDTLQGKKHGRGVGWFANGDSWNGTWELDKLLGFGVFTSPTRGVKYEGCLVNSYRCGKGKFYFSDGACYDGDWVEDRQEGSGSQVYADGSKYEGEWRHGKKNGVGKLIHSNGSTYNGDWSEDSMHGIGTLVYANGSKYKGTFHHNERNGCGTFIYADTKEIYTGEWLNDKRHGRGSLSSTATDARLFMSWINDVRHGRGHLRVNDKDYAVEYEMGKLVKQSVLSDEEYNPFSDVHTTTQKQAVPYPKDSSDDAAERSVRSSTQFTARYLAPKPSPTKELAQDSGFTSKSEGEGRGRQGSTISHTTAYTSFRSVSPERDFSERSSPPVRKPSMGSSIRRVRSTTPDTSHSVSDRSSPSSRRHSTNSRSKRDRWRPNSSMESVTSSTSAGRVPRRATSLERAKKQQEEKRQEEEEREMRYQSIRYQAERKWLPSYMHSTATRSSVPPGKSKVLKMHLDEIIPGPATPQRHLIEEETVRRTYKIPLSTPEDPRRVQFEEMQPTRIRETTTEKYRYHSQGKLGTPSPNRQESCNTYSVPTAVQSNNTRITSPVSSDAPTDNIALWKRQIPSLYSSEDYTTATEFASPQPMSPLSSYRGDVPMSTRSLLSPSEFYSSEAGSHFNSDCSTLYSGNVQANISLADIYKSLYTK